MCDGVGRQFSYSCPNTTLFQQRMLVCDHWYMVNCSKAESDYTANLLIGQSLYILVFHEPLANYGFQYHSVFNVFVLNKIDNFHLIYLLKIKKYIAII